VALEWAQSVRDCLRALCPAEKDPRRAATSITSGYFSAIWMDFHRRGYRAAACLRPGAVSALVDRCAGWLTSGHCEWGGPKQWAAGA